MTEGKRVCVKCEHDATDTITFDDRVYDVCEDCKKKWRDMEKYLGRLYLNDEYLYVILVDKRTHNNLMETRSLLNQMFKDIDFINKCPTPDYKLCGDCEYTSQCQEKE